MISYFFIVLFVTCGHVRFCNMTNNILTLTGNLYKMMIMFVFIRGDTQNDIFFYQLIVFCSVPMTSRLLNPSISVRFCSIDFSVKKTNLLTDRFIDAQQVLKAEMLHRNCLHGLKTEIKACFWKGLCYK